MAPPLAAQVPRAATGPSTGPSTGPAPAPTPAAAEERAAPAAAIDDPYEAYAAGLYGQALQGFTDQQIERPDDPAVALNLGSAHYQMRNYAEADRVFSRAAMAADPALRGQALYNLGNSAYRQGRLEEAVELYKAALEIDPDDRDAKFNLEFVRDEIRRRHEEAQKRQQEQQNQQQQQQQPQDQQQQQDPQREQQQEQPQDQQQPDQPPAGSQPDADRDGLPDATERGAENPTDPDNPDTDGDGLADGEEDRDRNGRVDPGETDPNNPDSDGDGVPDAQEADGGEPESQAGGDAAEGDPGQLSAEEAERYLQALEEGRPERRLPRQGARRRPAKDW